MGKIKFAESLFRYKGAHTENCTGTQNPCKNPGGNKLAQNENFSKSKICQHITYGVKGSTESACAVCFSGIGPSIRSVKPQKI